jgi:hypothetical protein
MRDWAVNDQVGGVRQAAMKVLTSVRPDLPDVLALLRERAVDDPDSRVRWTAVQTIIAARPADAATLALARGVEPAGSGFQLELT